MNCIFCNQESSASRSVEHIIPESIGNKDYILPAGVVCDKCNNYFARKVEGPLLETHYMRTLCYMNRIPNKRGNSARIKVFDWDNRTGLDIYTELEEDKDCLTVSNKKDEKRWMEAIRSQKSGRLIVPMPEDPDKKLLSRFLAKVSIEALAELALSADESILEVSRNVGLDALRHYARRGERPGFWPFHYRRLFPANHIFGASTLQPYKLLYSWRFVYTEVQELIFVLLMFGSEYAMNMGGPDVNTYRAWLKTNCDRSPIDF